MQCCEKNKSAKKPSKLLYLCILGPIAIVAALVIFKIPLTSLLLYAPFLACPLMHIFMMKDHNHQEKK